MDPNKEVHIKVTRLSEYGERYKLFVINKGTFENSYNFEDYGMNLVNENNQTIVDTIKWNGKAKKNGIEIGDIISEVKIENLNRPNKNLVYPFSFGLLLIFGYLNYRNYEFKKN